MQLIPEYTNNISKKKMELTIYCILDHMKLLEKYFGNSKIKIIPISKIFFYYNDIYSINKKIEETELTEKIFLEFEYNNKIYILIDMINGPSFYPNYTNIMIIDSNDHEKFTVMNHNKMTTTFKKKNELNINEIKKNDEFDEIEESKEFNINEIKKNDEFDEIKESKEFNINEIKKIIYALFGENILKEFLEIKTKKYEKFITDAQKMISDYENNVNGYLEKIYSYDYRIDIKKDFVRKIEKSPMILFQLKISGIHFIFIKNILEDTEVNLFLYDDKTKKYFDVNTKQWINKNTDFSENKNTWMKNLYYQKRIYNLMNEPSEKNNFLLNIISKANTWEMNFSQSKKCLIYKKINNPIYQLKIYYDKDDSQNKYFKEINNKIYDNFVIETQENNLIKIHSEINGEKKENFLNKNQILTFLEYKDNDKIYILTFINNYTRIYECQYNIVIIDLNNKEELTVINDSNNNIVYSKSSNLINKNIVYSKSSNLINKNINTLYEDIINILFYKTNKIHQTFKNEIFSLINDEKKEELTEKFEVKKFEIKIFVKEEYLFIECCILICDIEFILTKKLMHQNSETTLLININIQNLTNYLSIPLSFKNNINLYKDNIISIKNLYYKQEQEINDWINKKNKEKEQEIKEIKDEKVKYYEEVQKNIILFNNPTTKLTIFSNKILNKNLTLNQNISFHSQNDISDINIFFLKFFNKNKIYILTFMNQKYNIIVTDSTINDNSQFIIINSNNNDHDKDNSYKFLNYQMDKESITNIYNIIVYIIWNKNYKLLEENILKSINTYILNHKNEKLNKLLLSMNKTTKIFNKNNYFAYYDKEKDNTIIDFIIMTKIQLFNRNWSIYLIKEWISGKEEIILHYNKKENNIYFDITVGTLLDETNDFILEIKKNQLTKELTMEELNKFKRLEEEKEINTLNTRIAIKNEEKERMKKEKIEKENENKIIEKERIKKENENKIIEEKRERKNNFLNIFFENHNNKIIKKIQNENFFKKKDEKRKIEEEKNEKVNFIEGWLMGGLCTLMFICFSIEYIEDLQIEKKKENLKKIRE